MDVKYYEKIKEFYSDIFGIISIINDIINELWNFRKSISEGKEDVKFVIVKMYELTSFSNSVTKKFLEFTKEIEALSTSFNNFVKAMDKSIFATWNVITYMAKRFELTDKKITKNEMYIKLIKKEPEELFEMAISGYADVLKLCDLITDDVSNFLLKQKHDT